MQLFFEKTITNLVTDYPPFIPTFAPLFGDKLSLRDPMYYD